MAFDFEKWAAEQVAEATANVQKKVDRARKTFHFYTVLKHSGFEVPKELGSYELNYGFKVKIDREELPKLQETLGKLELMGNELVDADRAIIGINVKPKGWDGCPITFQYQKTLSVEQRCKIVTHTPPSYQTLVCSNKVS